MPPSPIQLVPGRKPGYRNSLLCIYCEQNIKLGKAPKMRMRGTCEHYFLCSNAVHATEGMQWVALVNWAGWGKCDHPSCNYFYDNHQPFQLTPLLQVLHLSGSSRILVFPTPSGQIQRYLLFAPQHPPRPASDEQAQAPAQPDTAEAEPQQPEINGFSLISTFPRYLGDPWKDKPNDETWPFFEKDGQVMVPEEGAEDRFKGFKRVVDVMWEATKGARISL